ncbi:MAG TPA: ankyrin repeat domain-containing protein, partial [Gammaproteobacteria bacterium]|nr:ankyrin repeat domain-containing protein [Gammaproteobacteria bacterium]
MLNNAFLHAEDINFSLLTAIKTGNENRVREILDSLQRPILENIRDEEDYKPNLLIMGSHSPAIVVELLKAYPNISSCEKNLALIHAASRGCTQTIVEILTRCSDIKRSDQAASIICAAKCGQIQAFVELILRCWADLTHNDKEMVLFEISDYGEPLVELINRCGTEINSDLKGFTLRRAARNGNYQTIVELLARWNDEISNIDKGEALDNAASRGHSQVIREILNRCDAEIESEDKAFALIHAVECVHLNALNTLLAYPSVEEVANYDNNQALTEALTRADSNSGYRLQYQLIVDRLMQIPAVANLTAQQSQQAMIDLSYITQFAENSMQA